MAQGMGIIVEWYEGSTSKGFPYKVILNAGDFNLTNTDNALTVDFDDGVTRVGSIGDENTDFVSSVSTNSSWTFTGLHRPPAETAATRTASCSQGQLSTTTDNADHRRFCVCNGTNDWECYRTQQDDTIKRGQITYTIATTGATLSTTAWDEAIWWNRLFPVTVVDVCCRHTGTSMSIKLKNTSSGSNDIIADASNLLNCSTSNACASSLSNTALAVNSYVYFDINASSAATRAIITIVYTKD